MLSGFTLTNGATQTTGDSYKNQSGGGVWCEGSNAVVSNCVLTGNSADYDGGGVCNGTLNNCTLTGNSAYYKGGGAYYSTLNNCIIYYNKAISSGGNYDSGTLSYCCTRPLPDGVGNLTNAPLFVDTNGWSDLRLQSNSPCINAGNNSYTLGPTDLDGNPRIAGGRVDIGAYEFQGVGLNDFAAWLWQRGLPTDGSADYVDSDQDKLNNWQEWRCGTDPTNALSVLRLLSPVPHGSNVELSWESVAGVNYALEWSTNLDAAPVFQSLATNLPGQPGATTFTHTNGASGSRRFYRVSVP